MGELLLTNRRSATLPSPQPSRLKPSIHPFPDEGPLELGKRGENPEHQFPLSTGGVDFLCETFQGNASLFQHLHRFDELPHGPGQTVELPNDNHIALTGHIPGL